MSETRTEKVGSITMLEEQSRSVIERFNEAFLRGDVEALVETLSEDHVSLYPQSGERFVGQALAREEHKHYPGGIPKATVLRVTGQGELWVGEYKLTYSDNSTWFMCTIFELRDGKIAQATSYFGEPFDAPEWRVKLMEQSGRS